MRYHLFTSFFRCCDDIVGGLVSKELFSIVGKIFLSTAEFVDSFPDDINSFSGVFDTVHVFSSATKTK